MKRTRQRKVRRTKTRGGHPVKSDTIRVADDACVIWGENNCVPQTSYALGYLEKDAADYLQKLSEGYGVGYDSVADILNFKYGGDHRFSYAGILDHEIAKEVPPGYSTFGLYYPYGFSYSWHAVIIFNFKGGHIGYIDPQISGKKRLLNELSPEIRETVMIVIEMPKMPGTAEENNVVGIEDIDQMIKTNEIMTGIQFPTRRDDGDQEGDEDGQEEDDGDQWGEDAQPEFGQTSGFGGQKFQSIGKSRRNTLTKKTQTKFQ